MVIHEDVNGENILTSELGEDFQSQSQFKKTLVKKLSKDDQLDFDDFH